MKLSKSTRHSKITGDFAEQLILYWLSKYGFECAKVDHTGIDIIAKNPHSEELFGISVKSRSRSIGTEQDSVTIQNDHFLKVEKACEAFGCIPYFAIVVDANETITAFLLSMDELEKISPQRKKTSSWKMRPKNIEAYRNNPNITIFELNSSVHRWFDEAENNNQAKENKLSWEDTYKAMARLEQGEGERKC